MGFSDLFPVRSVTILVACLLVMACTVPLPGDNSLRIKRAETEGETCQELAMQMRELEMSAIGLVPDARRASLAGKAVTGFDTIVVWPALALMIDEQDKSEFRVLRDRHQALEDRARIKECEGPRDTRQENLID